MSRVRLACAGLCLAVLVGSACSDDGGSKKAKHKSTTTSTTSTTVGTGTATTTPPTGPGSNRLPAVGVGTAAPLGNNLVVTVTKIEPVTLQAHGIGETAGPGVVVTVVLKNDTGAPIDTNGMAVNAHYGSATPATPNDGAPAEPFHGTLASGQSATGKYAFRVPKGQEGSVVVDLQHSGAPNVVIVDATK
ncbi:MAG: hypothetical protein ACXVJW_16850 [Acidimicrobiia bacterium]